MDGVNLWPPPPTIEPPPAAFPILAEAPAQRHPETSPFATGADRAAPDPAAEVEEKAEDELELFLEEGEDVL